MFLASTSDILRIVTGSAVSTIGVEAAWVDNASASYTPGRTNTAITTATTTTVVASPGASTVRNVRSLIITNNHASSSNVITIQHFDGTTSVDIEKITLKAGESFVMSEDGEWRHLTAAGGEYEYAGPDIPNYGIAGTVAETVSRTLCAEANGSLLATTVPFLALIYLKAGQVVSNISFFSATTGAGTPTVQIFALYSLGGMLLARSVDDGSTAWAANTIKTLAMQSPYTVQVSGFYYVSCAVSATTVPTLKSITASSVFPLRNPVLRGAVGTGTPGAEMLNAPSGASSAVWAAVT